MTREEYISYLRSVALDIWSNADEIIGKISGVTEINIAIEITPNTLPSYTTTRNKQVIKWMGEG